MIITSSITMCITQTRGPTDWREETKEENDSERVEGIKGSVKKLESKLMWFRRKQSQVKNKYEAWPTEGKHASSKINRIQYLMKHPGTSWSFSLPLLKGRAKSRWLVNSQLRDSYEVCHFPEASSWGKLSDSFLPQMAWEWASILTTLNIKPIWRKKKKGVWKLITKGLRVQMLSNLLEYTHRYFFKLIKEVRGFQKIQGGWRTKHEQIFPIVLFSTHNIV